MAKYGSFLYGAELYGEGAETAGGLLLWAITVDWNNDGSFDGENEAGYMTGTPQIQRGNQNYIAQSGNGFEHAKPDNCVIMLDNKDRRYDPHPW